MKTVLKRMSARRGMLYAPWPTDTSVSALPYKPLINYLRKSPSGNMSSTIK